MSLENVTLSGFGDGRYRDILRNFFIFTFQQLFMNQLTGSSKPRISSIDMLRGTIMIVMALDHTRDFFHQPAIIDTPTNLLTTTPAIFFTRWITHFCAPIFLFLSGMSAFISGQRKTKKELSSFLLKRGVWLILVEVVIVTFGITFNPFFNVVALQVIWAIGCSMIILGLLVRTSYSIILVTGIILFFCRNIFDYVPTPATGASGTLLRLFITSSQTFIPINSAHSIFVVYAILPWTSIMLLGYCFGNLYKKEFDPIRRRKILLSTGIGAVLLFILLRLINEYGDSSHWSTQKNATFTFISYLNVTKYPASLLYACMTLGPAMIFLSLYENVNNGLSRFLTVYGKVPFFYYILHFYLIHVLCMIFFFASGYTMNQAIDPGSFFVFRPVLFGYPLWVVYCVWAFVFLSLYYPCRWFGKYKRQHSDWWISYL